MTGLIVGLGTGRCGTRSLAGLLARQPEVEARHERKPTLSWEREPDPGRHLSHGATSDVRWFADVGFYYLPHVERLRSMFPGVRFVCLRRERGPTIESFVRAGSGRRWFEREGDIWSRCFPDYPGLPLAKQAGAYWDDYYDHAERLSGADFRVFDTEQLNDAQGVAEILEFAGCGAQRVIAGLRVTDKHTVKGG